MKYKINVYINNIKLKHVTNIQFVSISIEYKLNWSNQINYVLTKFVEKPIFYIKLNINSI